MSKVYLAGGISGFTYEEAEDWRIMVREALASFGIKCYSPLRGKQFLRPKGVIEPKGYDEHPLSTSRGIMARDFYDCTTADLVLANVLHAQTVSIGTCLEIAWAYAFRKPLVLVSGAGNPHDHPMVAEAISYRVTSLTEAIQIIRAVLLP